MVEVVLEVERCPGKVDALALLCQRERVGERERFSAARDVCPPPDVDGLAAPGPNTHHYWISTLNGEQRPPGTSLLPYRSPQVESCVPGIIDIN